MSKAETKVIEIIPPALQVAVLTLVGDSPLVCHAWSDKAKKEMLDKHMQKAKKPREAKVPERDFHDSLFWKTKRPKKVTETTLKKAKFQFPSICFKASAVGACRFSEGIPMTKARGAFHVLGEFVELDAPPPIMREDMVRLPNGNPDIRFRGEFPTWQVVLQVQYNANVISLEQLMNLFATAGFHQGVGEMRPEKGRQFGMFHVAASSEMAMAAE